MGYRRAHLELNVEERKVAINIPGSLHMLAWLKRHYTSACHDKVVKQLLVCNFQKVACWWYSQVAFILVGFLYLLYRSLEIVHLCNAIFARHMFEHPVRRGEERTMICKLDAVGQSPLRLANGKRNVCSAEAMLDGHL